MTKVVMGYFIVFLFYQIGHITQYGLF